MDYNCHIPDFVQAFSYAENGGLNGTKHNHFGRLPGNTSKALFF